MSAKTHTTDMPVLGTMTYPPHTIQDEHGETVGVVLSRHDYRLFLRVLASHTNWETLPPYLQDEIDIMLADEALAEGKAPLALRDLLAREQA